MRRIQKNKKSKGRLHLENVDVREVLNNLGIGYKESGKNVGKDWIGVNCPFCGNQNYHMGICLKVPVISCFVCGKTGNILTYIAEELQSFPKALEALSEAVPRELRSYQEVHHTKNIKVELPKEANKKITSYHANYLESRGYDYQELTDKYNFHFIGPTGKWKNRIIVPVVRNYKIITFTSIAISENSNLRYRHLEEEKSVIPIKEYLFGLEFTDGASVIVTEGLFDMMRIGDDAVCTFGTMVTPEQKKLLSKFSTVKILFDGDSAGRIAGEKLANDLAPFCDCKIFDLPEGIDPDKLSKEDIKKIKNS